MENLRIVNYELEHGEGSFPPFRCLSEQENAQLLSQLALAMGYNGCPRGQEVAAFLRDRSRTITNIHDKEYVFNLRSTLKYLGVSVSKKVFLNWGHFDEVVEMDIDIVANCFCDLWYPHSDDIDLIDVDVQWTLLIEHDGRVGFNSFSGPCRV